MNEACDEKKSHLIHFFLIFFVKRYFYYITELRYILMYPKKCIQKVRQKEMNKLANKMRHSSLDASKHENGFRSICKSKQHFSVLFEEQVSIKDADKN